MPMSNRHPRPEPERGGPPPEPEVGGYPGGNPSGRLPGERGELDEAAELSEGFDPAHPDVAHERPEDETDNPADYQAGTGPEVPTGTPEEIPDVPDSVEWPPGEGEVPG